MQSPEGLENTPFMGTLTKLFEDKKNENEMA